MFTSDEQAQAFYRKNRDSYIDAARACRQALTDPNGYWRLASDNPRLKSAVGEWVARARRAHSVLLGRSPMIRNFALITGKGSTVGDLYATSRKEA